MDDARKRVRKTTKEVLQQTQLFNICHSVLHVPVQRNIIGHYLKTFKNLCDLTKQ